MSRDCLLESFVWRWLRRVLTCIRLHFITRRFYDGVTVFGTQRRHPNRQERQVPVIEVAKRKGIYKGRRKGTTKADPTRAKQLRAKGLTVAEIATALATNKRTVQRYLHAEPANTKGVAKLQTDKLA